MIDMSRRSFTAMAIFGRRLTGRIASTSSGYLLHISSTDLIR